MSFEGDGGNAPRPQDVAATAPAILTTAATEPETASAPESEIGRPPNRVHYAPLGLDTNFSVEVASNTIGQNPMARSDTALTGPFSPIRRRPTRVGTFKVEQFQDYEVRPGWHRTCDHYEPPLGTRC